MFAVHIPPFTWHNHDINEWRIACHLQLAPDSTGINIYVQVEVTNASMWAVLSITLIDLAGLGVVFCATGLPFIQFAGAPYGLSTGPNEWDRPTESDPAAAAALWLGPVQVEHTQ